MQLGPHEHAAAARAARIHPGLCRLSTPILLLWCAATWLTSASPARAQEVEISYRPAAPPAGPSVLVTSAWVAAGAASGFLLHESGHVVVNLLLGNRPRFRGISVWGFVPFVVISPDIKCKDDACTKRDGQPFKAGRKGNFAIVTAGFTVQHLTDEILLGTTPDLASQYAPFRQGLLGFNVLLSAIYAAGAYTRLEDAHGDVRGAARTLRIHETWVATALLVPAALDVYRYFVPSASWAAWASRAVKAAMFGVTFVF